MRRPLAIEVFCGVGGMSLGLEAAGFDIKAAIDINPIHAATHHFNFNYCQTICADIRSFYPPKDYFKDIDLIAFGSPCQSFSTQGLNKPNDPRSSLSFEALRLILKIRPKYFLMENVPAIASSKNRHILNSLIQCFEEGGYQIVRSIQTLNAADFGVPQNRKRLFLIGYRNDCQAPTYPAIQNYPNQVSDYILDLAGIEPFIKEDLGIDAQILENHSVLSAINIPDRFSRCHVRQGKEKVWGHLASDHSDKVRDRFSQTKPGNKEPISRFYKLAPKKQAHTLLAGTFSNRGSYTAARPIHYKHPRCITAREAARLHGYPDWFQFNRTTWHSHRQIGNSVCPPVAKALGESIINCLGEYDFPTEDLQPSEEKLLTYSVKQAAEFFRVEADIDGKRLKPLELAQSH